MRPGKVRRDHLSGNPAKEFTFKCLTSSQGAHREPSWWTAIVHGLAKEVVLGDFSQAAFPGPDTKLRDMFPVQLEAETRANG